jgi:hypothetical protein
MRFPTLIGSTTSRSLSPSGGKATENPVSWGWRTAFRRFPGVGGGPAVVGLAVGGRRFGRGARSLLAVGQRFQCFGDDRLRGGCVTQGTGDEFRTQERWMSSLTPARRCCERWPSRRLASSAAGWPLLRQRRLQLRERESRRWHRHDGRESDAVAAGGVAIPWLPLAGVTFPYGRRGSWLGRRIKPSYSALDPKGTAERCRRVRATALPVDKRTPRC